MINFESLKPSVNIQEAVMKLNKAMDWCITIPDTINEKELYRIVCNPNDEVLNRLMNVPNDYEVYNLPESYKTLFQYLNF